MSELNETYRAISVDSALHIDWLHYICNNLIEG